MIKLISFRFLALCFINICCFMTSNIPGRNVLEHEKSAIFGLIKITLENNTEDVVELLNKETKSNQNLSENNQKLTENDLKILVLTNIIVSGLVIVLTLTLVRLLINKRHHFFFRLRKKDFPYRHRKPNKENDRLSSKAEQMEKRSSGNDAENSEMPSKDNKQYQQLFSHMQDYLLQDLNFAKSNIDIERLVSIMHTNRTTLTKAVKVTTNKTPMVYVNHLRLEKTKEMLVNNPEYTVETIAEKCGFNLRTFHRLFINQYRMTPTQYRKVHTPLTY